MLVAGVHLGVSFFSGGGSQTRGKPQLSDGVPLFDTYPCVSQNRMWDTKMVVVSFGVL